MFYINNKFNENLYNNLYKKKSKDVMTKKIILKIHFFLFIMKVKNITFNHF